MAPTQHGTDVEVGIGDYTYAGTIVHEAGFNPTADEENIQSEDGDTETELFWDPGKEINLRTTVLANDTASDLAIGDVITINSIACAVRRCQATRTGRVMRLEIAAAKKDSVAYA